MNEIALLYTLAIPPAHGLLRLHGPAPGRSLYFPRALLYFPDILLYFIFTPGPQSNQYATRAYSYPPLTIVQHQPNTGHQPYTKLRSDSTPSKLYSTTTTRALALTQL